MTRYSVMTQKVFLLYSPCSRNVYSSTGSSSIIWDESFILKLNYSLLISKFNSLIKPTSLLQKTNFYTYVLENNLDISFTLYISSLNNNLWKIIFTLSQYYEVMILNNKSFEPVDHYPFEILASDSGIANYSIISDIIIDLSQIIKSSNQLSLAMCAKIESKEYTQEFYLSPEINNSNLLEKTNLVPL